MTKQELHEWTSPLVHTAERAAFLAENYQHLTYLLLEWEKYGPNNRTEAIQQLLHTIYDYGKAPFELVAAAGHRPDLRRVRFAKYQPKETQPCTETGWVAGMGWFHRWADTYEEFAAGPAQYTMALVEDDDGNVHFVHPEKLQFITPTPTLP